MSDLAEDEDGFDAFVREHIDVLLAVLSVVLTLLTYVLQQRHDSHKELQTQKMIMLETAQRKLFAPLELIFKSTDSLMHRFNEDHPGWFRDYVQPVKKLNQARAKTEALGVEEEGEEYDEDKHAKIINSLAARKWRNLVTHSLLPLNTRAADLIVENSELIDHFFTEPCIPSFFHGFLAHVYSQRALLAEWEADCRWRLAPDISFKKGCGEGESGLRAYVRAAHKNLGEQYSSLRKNLHGTSAFEDAEEQQFQHAKYRREWLAAQQGPAQQGPAQQVAAKQPLVVQVSRDRDGESQLMTRPRARSLFADSSAEGRVSAKEGSMPHSEVNGSMLLAPKRNQQHRRSSWAGAGLPALPMSGAAEGAALEGGDGQTAACEVTLTPSSTTI
jgi:hypothetical protein